METLFSLKGHTALVTGASSGLGQHFAKTLVKAGAKVALVARRTDRLSQFTDELNSMGATASFHEIDVTKIETIVSALDQLEKELGLIDILVNNAGVANTLLATEIVESEWDRVIDTNLKGAWLVAQQVAQRLIQQNQPGTIINISSIMGYRVAKAVSSYAASKAGLIQLTKSLALEWAKENIRVNAIAPGYFMTEMNKDFFEGNKEEGIVKKYSATTNRKAGRAFRFATPSRIPRFVLHDWNYYRR